MPEFSALILDTRYSVPTLRLGLAAAADAAADLVERLLAESPYYRAVELRADGEVVVRLEREGLPLGELARSLDPEKPVTRP